ncbi:F0F1 ATP synthase subunit delta [Humibacter ginsenosidimutans]|uniref:ATP synthase subunit delta n=1 Tax=Humibacter ginsenosidimutans TaxID=2599293 RepID=A0A5B8M738_9MICO|nr:F0F1 ATP synthase subunit delta [Humibacter ginsenosidimutans]QDZ16548.1 F0F1 ATP synthase subunit delta [Humibacter ginsenosidimutans]
MGSATRESLAAAEAALSAAPTVTIQTGEQLLSAGRIIDGSAQLRSVLSDPDSANKGQLVRTIFRSLDETASSLLVGMADSRWSSTDQFLDAVEEIGIRAIARASGDDGTIESELFSFAKAVESDAELELALGSKLGDPERRVALVDALLTGRASEATIVLLRYVVQNQRGRRIGELISRVADIVAHDADAIVVTLTAATAPTTEQLDRLRTALTARYGRTPRFDVTVDPELVGGLRVQVGDEVIDGSIANRLADLRLRLAG